MEKLFKCGSVVVNDTLDRKGSIVNHSNDWAVFLHSLEDIFFRTMAANHLKRRQVLRFTTSSPSAH